MAKQDRFKFLRSNWREWFPETMEGIDRVERNADSEWFLFALMSLCRVAKEKQRLTADDVADCMHSIACEMPFAPPSTHDKRAMGAVMRQAAKAGWIESTKDFDQCRRANQHDCPKRFWRSLIFGKREVRHEAFTNQNTGD